MKIISSFVSPKRTEAILVEKQQVAENIWYVKLKVSEPMILKPGQYVSLRVNEVGMRRSYSVASFEKGKIGLVVDVTPKGLGSIFIEKLGVGEKVELMGFFGDFLVNNEALKAMKKVFFVATGVGIAPFGLMIERILENGFKGEVFLIWGLRHIRGVYWTDYLNDIKRKYKNFDYQLYLSKPESEWHGKTGHVGDYLKELDTRDSAWYLCGSNEMINQTKETLLTKGVMEENINYEKFY